jgi:polysaccharide pyruvyl transferase WcaK-like protein
MGRLAGPAALSLSRFVIRRTDLLVLRDEESATGLAGAGLPGPFRVAADPAWSLLAPPDDGRGISHGPVRLVPSCLATAGDGWLGLIDRVAGMATRLQADGLRVQIQAWQHSADPAFRDDAMLVGHVARRLGSSVEVVPPSPSLPAATESMRGLGAVVASRFHALVAAGAAGVPSVAVAHERKLAALARRLGQRTIPVDFDPAQGAALVREAVAAPGPSAASVKEQIAQAEEGFRLLRVLLAGGQSEESDALGALPLVPAPQSA